MRVHKSKIAADPVKYYTHLIGMDKYEARMRQEPNAITIITGIVLYRELPKNKQSEVLKLILALNDGQLKASLYGLVSQWLQIHTGSHGHFLIGSSENFLIPIRM